MIQIEKIFSSSIQVHQNYTEITEKFLENIQDKIQSVHVKTGVESNKFESRIVPLFPMFVEEIKFISVRGGADSESSIEGLSEKMFYLQQEINENSEDKESKT